MPRLRVLVGPDPNSLTPITANNNKAYPIKSDAFEGRVVVYIKGLVDERGRHVLPAYFDRKERGGVTWSIQVQGRFLQPHSADDILFGNTFDRPLKLPWGSSAALKFMHFVDPTLDHDLGSKRPWALSPLVATMPYFAHSIAPPSRPLPPFPTYHSITDDTSSLFPAERRSRRGADSDVRPLNLGPPRQRRGYFSSPANRKQVIFGPNDLLTTDFCYGFLSFPALSLNLPGGLSFDLIKYWDGQPVRFVCCHRSNAPFSTSPDSSPASSRSGSSSSLSERYDVISSRDSKVTGPGKIFWCVEFQIIQDEDEEED